MKQNFILKNYSLKPHNTFGLEADCALFAQVTSVEAAKSALRRDNPLNLPIYILGSGSNILLTQAHYEVLVLRNFIRKIEIIKRDTQKVWLLVGGGVVWHDLVCWTLERGLSGLENLSLIPGTVGAAPIQNIGAYGVEIADKLLGVEGLNLETLEVQFFAKEVCAFGYRDSIFKQQLKGKYMVTKILLELSREPVVHLEYGDIRTTLEKMHIDITTATPKNVSDAIIQIRQSKLPNPDVIGNAGSFFKNPVIAQDLLENIKTQYPSIPYYVLDEQRVKIPAGWLIEQCAWKGKRVGHTGCHLRQALVIVNYGGATGEEILKHSENVQASVLDKFGIHLEREVNVW